MYGKVFESMFDGTLASKGPWQALVTFQQMIVLADQDGFVDMTADAIARRTSIPIEIIETGIAALVQPDPKSRTPDEDGRRIVPLEDHRDWGWQIVNHSKYQQMRKAEERREYLRVAQAERRARIKAVSTPVNNVNTVSAFVSTSTPKDTDKDTDKDALREAPAVLVECKAFNATKYRVPDCPYKEILDAYHELLPMLPAVVVFSTSRKAAMRSRWAEVCAAEKFDANAGIAWFRAFLAGVRKSKFLTGNTNPGRDRRPFKADLEWLLKPGNFAKVVEGRYHGENA